MKQDLVCKVSIEIKAPKSNVWDAVTNPEKIKQYLFGTNAISDWKVGSAITFSGEWEGKPYEDKGTILKMEKEKLFQYNYWSSFSGSADLPENYQTITYSFSEKNGITTFDLVQENCKSKEARDHSIKNWTMVLGTMKEMLEKGK